MGFFHKLQKQKGGYIFLSHSHDDIEEVRKIRNALEKDGFEPLCFYLKCLDDEAEIEDLIKREIDAREWFIFVNSENSRNSRWVTLEREYIARTNRKKIISVDIGNPRSIAEAIRKISHNLRVFIVHNGIDTPIANTIREKMRARDYLACTLDDLPTTRTPRWRRGVTNAIVDASKDGCVLLLLSAQSALSVYIKWIALYTLRKGVNIVPVMLGDVALDEDYRHYLKNRPTFHLPEMPTEEDLDALVEQIGTRIAQL